MPVHVEHDLQLSIHEKRSTALSDCANQCLNPIKTTRKDPSADTRGTNVSQYSPANHILRASDCTICLYTDPRSAVVHGRPAFSNSHTARTPRNMSAHPSFDTDARTGTDVDVEANEKETLLAEWKPQKKELLIMISLSFISLMVSLDATILVTVLPVSHTFSVEYGHSLTTAHRALPTSFTELP